MRKQLEAMKNKQREEVVDQLMKDFRNQKMAEIREQKEQVARAREEAVRQEKMLRAKEWEAPPSIVRAMRDTGATEEGAAQQVCRFSLPFPGVAVKPGPTRRGEQQTRRRFALPSPAGKRG